MPWRRHRLPLVPSFALFLSEGPHTFCGCSSHLLPFCWTWLTSPCMTPPVIKKAYSSFIFFTCSLFNQRPILPLIRYTFTPFLMLVLHFSRWGFFLLGLVWLQLKVLAGCSTWKLLPFGCRNDMFMLHSCSKIHRMSLLLSKALLRHVTQ